LKFFWEKPGKSDNGSYGAIPSDLSGRLKPWASKALFKRCRPAGSAGTPCRAVEVSFSRCYPPEIEVALSLFASPPAFLPLPVASPPPPVPLVGEVLFPMVVPIVPLDVAPATAAFAVSGGVSEPEAAKLAVIGASTKAKARARRNGA
jgi:hypothetical protein